MKINELKAQVSALDIKPGTIVVVNFNMENPTHEEFYTAKELLDRVRAVVPAENNVVAIFPPMSISAIDEAKMREIGWVRWSTVEQLVGCAELLASNLRRNAESVPDDDESVGLLYHADQVDAIVRRVKGIEPELPLG